MALDNIDANAPENMQEWVRRVEAHIQAADAKIASLQSQVNAK